MALPERENSEEEGVSSEDTEREGYGDKRFTAKIGGSLMVMLVL